MRVLATLTTYPPSTGGAQLHAHLLHQQLRGRDVDVHVATWWRDTRTDWALGTTLRAPPPRPDEVLDGVPVHHLGLTVGQRLAAGAALAAYPPAMRTVAPALVAPWAPAARRVVDRVAPDVLHLSRIGREWPYQAVVRAARARGVGYVLTPNHHPHWTRPWHWWWWELYRHANVVLVLSDAEAEQLVAGGVERDRIVRTVVGPVGAAADVDLAARPPAPDDPPTVAFLGQVRRYKGIEVLHAAMQRVWVDRPEVRLVVVGPWLDADEWVRRALAADPRVDLLGAVDEDVKWDVLRRCTLLCVPSEGEALGGVYLEAWTVGRPCVGADIPPVAELMARTGGGVAVARDPDVLATTLRGLLDDPERCAALGLAGRAAVAAEYRWDVAAERAAGAYERAVAEGPRPGARSAQPRPRAARTRRRT
ncbi:MAG: glycosyltransferase family 4 protein [Actinomycetes bacterium]